MHIARIAQFVRESEKSCQYERVARDASALRFTVPFAATRRIWIAGETEIPIGDTQRSAYDRGRPLRIKRHRDHIKSRVGPLAESRGPSACAYVDSLE